MPELEWPTVLVVGPTGVGKTSLLQAIFGNNLVPEDRIGHGAPHTSGFDLYESNGLRIYDCKGMEPGDQHADDLYQKYLQEFVEGLRCITNIQDHIHVIWYCIQGCGARITAKDIEIFNNLSPYFRILMIITKSDLTRVDQLESLMNVMTYNGIQKEIIFPISTKNTFQLDDLQKKTAALYESSHAMAVEHAARWCSDARIKVEEEIESAIKNTNIFNYRTEDRTKNLVAKIASIYGRTDFLPAFMYFQYCSPRFNPLMPKKHVRKVGCDALGYFSTRKELSKEEKIISWLYS